MHAKDGMPASSEAVADADAGRGRDRGFRGLLAAMPSASPVLRWAGIGLLGLAAVFPLLGGEFYTRLAIEAMLYGSIALSVDILLGYVGMLSLGQAAYFGLAAYTTAVLYVHVTQSFWLVAAIVSLSVALFALLLGAVAIRASGVYFALITFAVAEILLKIAHNTRALGGSDGIIGIPVPTVEVLGLVSLPMKQNLVFYYFVLGGIVLVYLGVRRLLNTAFGRVLQAVRDNPDRVPYLGYNPFWYKLLAYVLAAQVAAFGGLLYPLLRGFVSPELFSFEVSTKAVVMALVGGIGTLIGSLIGGVVITFLEIVLGGFTEHHLIVLGAIFVVFVLFLPDGFIGLARRLTGRRREGRP